MSVRARAELIVTDDTTLPELVASAEEVLAGVTTTRDRAPIMAQALWTITRSGADWHVMVDAPTLLRRTN